MRSNHPDRANEAAATAAEQALLAAIDAGFASPAGLSVAEIDQISSAHPAVAEQLPATVLVLRFLQQAAEAEAGAAVALPGAEVPDCLGDFRLLQKIGQGGMGIVYEAEQLSLARRVALKLLPLAAALDARQIRRFHNEAAAAAQLRHPHIVPVYAVGKDRGVHYYAMQFVAGRTLSQVLTELRRAVRPSGHCHSPGGQTSAASLLAAGDATARAAIVAGGVCLDRAYYMALARLAGQAADALDHAHDSGVVHRDVKPSNLMLDDTGHLWVADFGLAKVSGGVDVTTTGDLVGTLRYMAPEQAIGRRGLADHRADVYSLGATLYELATLKPAYAAKDRQQLLHDLAEREPRPAHSVEPAVPLDLATILVRAMQPDARDRYLTAAALADDLRRFASDRPVLARRPTLALRATKWVRRHRTLAATAAGGLLLSLIVLIVAVIRIAQADAGKSIALAEAKSALGTAEHERQRAEAHFGLALQAVDQMLARLGALRHELEPEIARAVMPLVEDAIPFYEALLRDKPGDVVLRTRIAGAHHQLARLRAEAGLVAEAEAAQQRAIAFAEDLVAEHPDVASHLALLGSMLFAQAQLLFESGRETESVCRRSIENLARALHLDAGATDTGIHLTRAGCLLAYVLADRGELRSADIEAHAAIDLIEQVAAVAPGDSEVRLVQAEGESALGRIHLLANQFERSADRYSRAVHLLETLIRERPLDQRFRIMLGKSLDSLLVASERLGRYEDAQATSARALAIWEKLSADFPANHSYRRSLAIALHRTGTAHYQRGSLAEAEAFSARAVALLEPLAAQPGTQHALGLFLVHAGWVAHDRGKLSEAREHLRRAIAQLGSLHAREPHRTIPAADLALAHERLAWVMLALGEPEEAERECSASIAIGKALVDQRPEYALTLYRSRKQMAHLHNVARRWEAARDAYAELTAEAEKMLREGPHEEWERILMGAYEELGVTSAATNDSTGAEAAFRRAAELVDRGLATGAGSLAEYRNFAFTVPVRLAWLLARDPERTDDARAWIQRALDAEQAWHGPKQAVFLHCRTELAFLLATTRAFDLRRPDAARELADRAVVDEPQSATAWAVLGVAACGCGDWPEAIEAIDKATQLDPSGSVQKHFGLQRLLEDARARMDQAWPLRRDAVTDPAPARAPGR